ncbi:phospholipase A2 inhibitor and Ly6/PLAUR domain-containing protein-like, partial [Emydura macquarii macquarii]|uniref:phospholipase A2 inhibitor and Ly6/PLAUR domain-containing protein-like n=1 Tax=Emydura macquarii macquarii TaxID=1129001 RepID=UPI00352B61ED
MASFILCLLPALLATTRAQGSLTCETCYGLAETCQAAPGTCAVTKGVGGCRSVAGESTLGGTKTSLFSKECVPDYNSGINVPITFTVGNGMYLRLNASRCNDTDNCNSAVLDVPQRNINLNGRQCPTCFVLNSGSCTTQVTPCTGDEIHCIDFTGQILK